MVFLAASLMQYLVQGLRPVSLWKLPSKVLTLGRWLACCSFCSSSITSAYSVAPSTVFHSTYRESPLTVTLNTSGTSRPSRDTKRLEWETVVLYNRPMIYDYFIFMIFNYGLYNNITLGEVPKLRMNCQIWLVKSYPLLNFVW